MKIDSLTENETNLFLENFKVKTGSPHNFYVSLRNRLMILLMLDCGIRSGELVQLRLLHVCIKDYPMESLLVSSDIAKNNHSRTIPFSSRLKQHIQLFIDTYWRPFYFSRDDYILSTKPHGNPISQRQVERLIKAYSIRSINRPIHPHVLRHTFATRLMRTCNSRIVQELLGHSNLNSTQIYTHPNSGDLKNAIEQIS